MLHNYFTIGLTHLAIARKKTLVDFKYIWDGKLISKVPSTTYSGLHIADNLCWNEHCDNNYVQEGELNPRSPQSRSKEVKSNAYLSLVRPKLEHACSLWNPYALCDIDKIETVQRRAARFVYNDYSRCRHASLMIDALGSLEHRTFVNQMCMFCKRACCHLSTSWDILNCKLQVATVHLFTNLVLYIKWYV